MRLVRCAYSLCIALLVLTISLVSGANATDNGPYNIKHVLLISVDGMQDAVGPDKLPGKHRPASIARVADQLAGINPASFIRLADTPRGPTSIPPTPPVASGIGPSALNDFCAPQVAPTILEALGIDPRFLDAVRVEGTSILPGLQIK